MPKRIQTTAPPEVQAVYDKDPAVQKAFAEWKAFLASQGVSSPDESPAFQDKMNADPVLGKKWADVVNNLTSAETVAQRSLPANMQGYGIRDSTGTPSKTETKMGWADYVMPFIPGVAGLAGAALSPAAQAAQGGGTAASSTAEAGGMAGNLGDIGVPAALAAPTATEAGGMASTLGNLGVPASLAAPTGTATAAAATTPGWSDLLRTGGQMLSKGAQGSAEQDLAQNTNQANYLTAQDNNYRTQLGGAVNVPAGLQRQALWSDFIQNEKSSNPNAPATSLLSPDQQAMVATQKAAILKKLAAANAAPLPTAPVAPPYQQPGAGTKAASTIGTVANVASKIPWSQVLSHF